MRDLPEGMNPDVEDMILAYESLQGATGISVGCSGSAIQTIHIHRSSRDNVAYEHQDLTPMFCPIGDGDMIIRIWYVVEDPGYYGLLVSSDMCKA